MPFWKVECEGKVREVYYVEADTEEQAKASWEEGALAVSESRDLEPVSAVRTEAWE